MTLREDVRQHLDRLNLTDAWLTDAQSRWSLTLLSQWMDTTEAAMVDADIDESRRRQVLDRVLYGSMPSRAEVELRERLTATLVDQRQWGIGGGNPVATERGYSESEPPSRDHGTIIITDGRG